MIIHAAYNGPPFPPKELSCGGCQRKPLGALPGNELSQTFAIDRAKLALLTQQATVYAPSPPGSVPARGWLLVLGGGLAAFYFLFLRKK